MALPSLMKHLAVLETAGLIKSQKISRVRTYTLDQERLASLEKWFSKQRAIWEERHKNLDDLLSTLDGEQNEQ
jgi:DNA-binding transcriptional ArsR family regulator